MVGSGGGSHGCPARAVQIRRSRPRSEVSVGISLVGVDKAHGGQPTFLLDFGGGRCRLRSSRGLVIKQDSHAGPWQPWRQGLALRIPTQPAPVLLPPSRTTR